MSNIPNNNVNIETQLRYIYNSFRTALLNKKYYGEKLSNYQKYNLAMELAIAIGAGSSGGIAGLAIWGTLSGQYAWLTISGLATALSVIKPILQTGKHIERYTTLHAGHSNVYLDLKSIVEDIETSRCVPTELASQYHAIRKRIVELGGLDDPRPDKSLIIKLQAQVNREILPESLWVP